MIHFTEYCTTGISMENLYGLSGSTALENEKKGQYS